MTSLLTVTDLSVDFGRRRLPAVRDVDFTLEEGERLGIIGESGSGKTVTALAVMGLLPENAHVAGSITWRGAELLGRPERELARLRGNAMSMVFQEPMTALDPTMRVGRQVAEAYVLHRDDAGDPAREKVLPMLAAVGLDDPERIADAFPHQLSGGQRQRVIMAMALINGPDLVICDEPTTALDVTVQARVLELLDQVLTTEHAACLFISHDLAVVSQVCQQVLVMLDGEVVERGPVASIFTAPQHPYTQGLVATARLDLVRPGDRLPTIDDFYVAAGRAGGLPGVGRVPEGRR
ncbi:MAG: ABC transporter ATP-binding protein [Propionicimonas sp.]|uniref:ABC transporter ATP-binding protein n=1 Tax=Propionicimonas sp. TaxID=1955623 RepID=UPI002B206709|nr:ABC transporter ATP-binding protein [Propionicimonas sp.]MEA4944127.1 ABC transporter ATP-binding protein [Propionicimonas sp.]MEA5118227.1 ABC transporter ATP-binding protein [Propionicimonas sp.]